MKIESEGEDQQRLLLSLEFTFPWNISRKRCFFSLIIKVDKNLVPAPDLGRWWLNHSITLIIDLSDWIISSKFITRQKVQNVSLVDRVSLALFLQSSPWDILSCLVVNMTPPVCLFFLYSSPFYPSDCQIGISKGEAPPSHPHLRVPFYRCQSFSAGLRVHSFPQPPSVLSYEETFHSFWVQVRVQVQNPFHFPGSSPRIFDWSRKWFFIF